MRFLIHILLVGIFFSCNKEKHFEGPDSFSDDFESYDVIDSLIDGDNERWSFFQLTYDENEISVDSTITHSGNRSIKFHATNSTEEKGASKASINKQFMAFWEGEVFYMSAWIYIEGNEEKSWLFLFDLEEKTAVGAGPGMRIALVEDHLVLEHKYLEDDVYQLQGSEIPFPRNQWVRLDFRTKLSQKDDGYIKVWQDDQLVLEDDNHVTLPKDILYFQQGTKGMYSQIEFGCTANTKDSETTLYVDEVMVKVIE